MRLSDKDGKIIKGFFCVFCDKEFSRIGYLRKHLIAHKEGRVVNKAKEEEGVQETGDLEGGGEDPPKTEIVEGGKKLKDKKGRYFDGFPCTLCPKVFSRTINLKAHLQAHEDGECLADGSRVRRERLQGRKESQDQRKHCWMFYNLILSSKH